MRRFYTGLLFFGASFGAHAAETHKHSHAAKHAPAAMHYTQYVPDTHASDSVLYSEFRSDASLFAAPRSAAADQSSAALTQSQKNLVNVLSALRYQRMSLQNEQMKLSVSPGAAVMETEHLQVAVRSDSTSISWHKTF